MSTYSIFFFIFSCNHHVNVRTEDHIRSNDRVYVSGHLSSKNLSLDDGRIRHALTIKGTHFQLKDKNESTAAENDINQIKIMAQICAEIRHTDQYSLFTLMTTHAPRYVDCCYFVCHSTLAITLC